MQAGRRGRRAGTQEWQSACGTDELGDLFVDTVEASAHEEVVPAMDPKSVLCFHDDVGHDVDGEPRHVPDFLQVEGDVAAEDSAGFNSCDRESGRPGLDDEACYGDVGLCVSMSRSWKG